MRGFNSTSNKNHCQSWKSSSILGFCSWGENGIPEWQVICYSFCSDEDALSLLWWWDSCAGRQSSKYINQSVAVTYSQVWVVVAILRFQIGGWNERHPKGGWAQPQDKLGDPRGTWKANVLHVDKSCWKQIRHLLRVPRKVTLKKTLWILWPPSSSRLAFEVAGERGQCKMPETAVSVTQPWIVYSSVFYCWLGWKLREIIYTECPRRLKTKLCHQNTALKLHYWVKISG